MALDAGAIATRTTACCEEVGMEFDDLYRKHYNDVYKVVRSFVKDEEAAHDVTQDSFFRAYLGMDNFHGDSSIATWLIRIGINTAKNYLKQQKRKVSTTPFKVVEGETLLPKQYTDICSPESVHSAAEMEDKLNECISDMPKELSEPFELSKMELMSYADISEHLGIPIGTVRSRIYRARKYLDKAVLDSFQG